MRIVVRRVVVIIVLLRVRVNKIKTARLGGFLRTTNKTNPYAIFKSGRDLRRRDNASFCAR